MGTDSQLRCTACGRENAADALFCDRCTFPLRVVKLADLTDADRRLCLSELFEQLAAATRDPTPGEPIDADLWYAYLGAFWLRPETAIIEYREAMAIRAALGSAVETPRPWLDLGCGDGIHSAITAGWRFDDAFDAFQCLDLSAPDLFNRFEPAEFESAFRELGHRIDLGFDIKPTAIARSTALNVFARVERADATSLPLEDRSVGTIFSNMLRDLGESLDAALGECARVLNDDGTLLLSVMTPEYADSLVFAPRAHDADARGDRAVAEQLLRLDRGRSVFCRQQLSIDAWDAKLAVHGLRVESTQTILTQEITRLWDVGLRPFSSDLLRWRAGATKAERLAVKRAMVPVLDHVLRPIVSRAAIGVPCMQLLVIRKGRP